MNPKRRNIDTTVIKGVIILFLTLLMLIPITLVQSLIEERAKNKEVVTEEITSKWGGEQTIAGPILVVPYEKRVSSVIYTNEDNNIPIQIETGYAYFLPDSYLVESDVKVEERSRSIYNTLVYQSQNLISGSFSFPKMQELNISKDDAKWENAFILIGVPYMQGIQNKVSITINGKAYDSRPGVTQNSVIASGITVQIPLQDYLEEEILNFSFKLNLNGSEKLLIAPIGKDNKIEMKSDWGVVSFTGDFLAQRDINEDGFAAVWNVLDYNRNYQQMWTGNYNQELPVVGAELKYPVDQYQMSIRSTKYAIMFIGLTFIIFFLVEIITRQRIHPVQYTLVSVALVLFYSLLISLSEHISFHIAYLVAAIAVVTMITLYMKTIFKKLSHTLAMGGFITLLYIYLYVILQLEDMSLLIGSIGLFIILACIMYASRKIDWYKDDETEEVK